MVAAAIASSGGRVRWFEFFLLAESRSGGGRPKVSNLGELATAYRCESSISNRVSLAKTTSCPRAIQVSKTTLPTS